MPFHPQQEANISSLHDPEKYWSYHGEQISWFKRPTRALHRFDKKLPSGNRHPSWQWFPGGVLNTCHNCVDRHVESGHGTQPAIHWHSEVAGAWDMWTYARLQEEVQCLAGVLRGLGIEKGDRVVIYMPMIPQALMAMLASARLGAVHAVVFGGFGAHALSQRIDACNPKVILTSSCGLEGAHKIIDYQPLVRDALDMCSSKGGKVLIWQRPQKLWDLESHNDTGNSVQTKWQELDWQYAVEAARWKGIKADCVPVRSEDPLYILYTSGTTGTPKGVQRDNGGHAMGVLQSLRSTAGIRGPGDVSIGISDIGWVTGHSYVLYGPLLVGAATVLFEGKPIGTPDAGIVWRLVQEYKINTIFTAPTALRAIRRADPELSFLKRVGDEGGLRTLRALWLTGERSPPALIESFQEMLAQYAADGAFVNDTYGLTEQGVPLATTALIPSAALDYSATRLDPGAPQKIQPGWAGSAMPGMELRVVDDAGKEIERGAMGNVVMGLPLSPSSFITLWKDEERFYTSYLKRFDGKWFDTGDAGSMTKDGYVQILSRSDDVINVAAHRLSTGAIEQAISTHPAVAECCVIGIPDELKGHLPFVFVVTFTPQDETRLFEEIQKAVRAQQGSIASLGGMISAKQGENLIPKTRSGKMLRRNLRDIMENAAKGEIEKEVAYPATIEDAGAIDTARQAIKDYWEKQGRKPILNGQTKSKL